MLVPIGYQRSPGDVGAVQGLEEDSAYSPLILPSEVTDPDLLDSTAPERSQ